MKIAVTGKGGAGKTFIAAGLARLYPEYVGPEGRAYAVDADPGGGLGAALGLKQGAIESVKPISDMSEFIETGEDNSALYLSSPDANGLSGRYDAAVGGVRYLRMAGLKAAGAGCYCREFNFLLALVNSMLIGDKDMLLLDMPAGVEPFTRGAVRGADILLIVSEPTRPCIEATKIFQRLGADLGIKYIYIVANKVRNENEEVFMRMNFMKSEFLGFVRIAEQPAANSPGDPAPAAHNADVEELLRNLLMKWPSK